MKAPETAYHKTIIVGPLERLEPPRASLARTLATCWRRAWGTIKEWRGDKE